jgi:multiple sugar transport system substrate-binding protein
MSHIRWIKRISLATLAGIIALSACTPAATPQVITQIVAGTPIVKEVLVTPTTAPQPTEKKLSGEIVIWGWPSADKAFEAIIQGFNQKYPDIKVTWQMNPGMAGGTRDALATALAAGEGAPDISMIEINDIGRFVMQGGLVDLLQPPFNAGKYRDQFVAYKWDQAMSPDGRLLAFPWDIGPASIFYRRDIFKKAGLPDAPEDVAKLFSTWQGYLDAGKKVANPAKNQFWMSNASDIPYIYYAHKNFFDENYNVAVNNPRTKQLLEYALEARKLKFDAKIPTWTQEWYSAIGNGQIATLIIGCWFGGFLKSWIDPQGAGNWGVVPIPEDPLQNWGGSFLAITEQSKNKEAAWAFIEYAMATADAQNRMFVTVDYFPAFKPAWDNPLYMEGDAYFGGENTRALWTKIATSPGKIFTTPMDATAEQAFMSEVVKMLDQNLDPQETLNNAEKAIQDATARDRETLMKMLHKE